MKLSKSGEGSIPLNSLTMGETFSSVFLKEIYSITLLIIKPTSIMSNDRNPDCNSGALIF